MIDWRATLAAAFSNTPSTPPSVPADPQAVEQFLTATVIPAFGELAAELAKHGQQAEIRIDSTEARLRIPLAQQIAYTYCVKVRSEISGMQPYPEVHIGSDLRYGVRSGHFRSNLAYSITDITRDEIIHNFLLDYLPYMRLARLSSPPEPQPSRRRGWWRQR